ncbi:MAG: hypothetical protein Q9159_002165 [Coniocarpon cinnabarinum]
MTHIALGPKISVKSEHRKRLLQEIKYFMTKSKVEQSQALSGKITTFYGYWSFRMGTSAVRIALALNEYELETPKDGDVNDIFSLRKELAEDAVDSIIPIFFASTGNAQESADIAMKLISHYVNEFEAAASDLLKSCEKDVETVQNVRRFIEGCRSYCTGNLEWSFLTGRYGASGAVSEKMMLIKL